MSFFGYVKLFQSILGSSIWVGPDGPLRVWITMLVLKNRDHKVLGVSVPGLANLAKVSVDECREALDKFQKPDPDSQSKEFEGRKIEELPEGGWFILNGQKYADMLSKEERNAYNRNWMREHRKTTQPKKRYGPTKSEREFEKNGEPSEPF